MKSHPAVWRWDSDWAHSSFVALSPLKIIVTRLFLLCLLFLRSPRSFPPLWLWKPTVANYGETKGRTWMGSLTAQAEKQSSRQPGGRRQRAASAVLLWKAAPHLLHAHSTGRCGKHNSKTMQPMLTQAEAPLLCLTLAFTLLLSPSSSLLSTSRLQLSVCKQIPAHVIRCLHHSSAFTAPSFLLPPPACLTDCLPFTLCLSWFFLPP